MFRVLAITEDSMMPEYSEGDFVLAAKIPFIFVLRPGDVIILQHPLYGLLVKRIEAISGDGQQITVLGTHPTSIDSRTFGPIAPQEVIGKVIWHVRRSHGG
jgi:nickel-type superoxide dismutase maturation protease